MLGASLSEVWGENFNSKPKKLKKKKFKQKPLTPDEMDSGLLIQNRDDINLMNEKQKLNELNEFKGNPAYYENYQNYSNYQNYQNDELRNPNIVSYNQPYGRISKTIENDPDYQEFQKFKLMKKNNNLVVKNKTRKKKSNINELLFYIGFGLLMILLYDNIYYLGMRSY
tara:strand:+ start:484 stop:990 length:507 start_codon:yes stop_codon:yes gene_type:complete